MLVGTPTSGTKKRMASIGSAGELAALGTGSEGRKRLRGGTPGQGQEKDVVLVSSDGARIPFSSRLLSASSPVWDSLMPPTIGSLRLASPFPASPSASPAGTPAPGELPEVHLPESADCLRYVLKFLEHKPVVPREVHFSRDWETIWRLIDHLTLALSRPTLPVTHLAPAFAFSLLFHLPDLSRSVAVDIAKALPGDECVFEEVAEGLERAKREWGIEGDGVEKLLTYLLSRTLVLSSTRTRALTALKSFDDAYDCKHSCRGLVYAQLCSLLTTSSRKRAFIRSRLCAD
ncbi:hypothetical protein JCM10213v2_000919 [Rhodosporidiobolus nylandii]